MTFPRHLAGKLSLTFIINNSGVVQLVAHGPLEPRILVRVQAPEPLFRSARRTLWRGIGSQRLRIRRA